MKRSPLRSLRRAAALGWAFAALGLLAPAGARANGNGDGSESTAVEDSARAAVAPGDSTSVAPAAGDSASAAARDSVAAAAARHRDYVAEARQNFSPETRAYSGIRTTLGFVAPAYGLLVALLILFSGLSAKMRDIARGLSSRLYVSLLVFLTLYTVADFVLAFPLAWYQGFALERQFDLSTQTLGGWLADLGKSAAVGIVVFGLIPILLTVYLAIRRWPRGWWLAAALGAIPLIVAGTLIQPLVIDPLYNTFTPLRDQHLKERILALAERAEIPARSVFEVDKSAQTVKFNAYVTGFGATQRIVLWDTMLQGMEEDEILFVMAHEVGHYRLGHIWKGIAYFSLLGFLLFFLVARLTGWAVRRFGQRWGFTEVSDIASLPLLNAALSLMTLIAQPAINAYSRRIEHESDVYAMEMTRDNDAGARAFLKLASQNRADPEPAPVVTFFEYTHPPLLERIRFAMDYRPWAEGKPNRFYEGPPARP